MEVELDLKRENKKDLVLKSLERKMKNYQFLERRVSIAYILVFTSSLSLLILGL